MAFRNIKCSIPKEFRCGYLVDLVGTDFMLTDYHVNLPTSCEYSLKDLLAAGVNVQSVNPTVIHDSFATSSVADNVISHSVEPSNND